MYRIKRSYWSNGNIKRETPFYKDKRQGQEKNYDKEGILKSTVDYNDDLIDGYIKTYFKSGMVESSELFHKGISMNELLIYNEDGVLVYSSSNNYIVDLPPCLYDDDYCFKKHF